MKDLEIVTLDPTDWEIYKNLRLRALKEDPQAYYSTYADNVTRPNDFWMARLNDAAKGQTQWLVFAKLQRKVVGMMGAFAEKEIDNAHIISVYVAPEARGQGISKLLMHDLISKIKQNKLIKKITVEVNPIQLPAFNLYKNSGFEEVLRYKMVLGDGKEHDVVVLEQLTTPTS